MDNSYRDLHNEISESERIEMLGSFVICYIKHECFLGECKVQEIDEGDLPLYFNSCLKKFYQKCAPIELKIGKYIFFPYEDTFKHANGSKGDFIPIAYIEEIKEDTIIYAKGNDEIIRRSIGGGQGVSVFLNIFDFIANIVNLD